MNADVGFEARCLRRWDPRVQGQPLSPERRRSRRVGTRLAFDVYERCVYLGRFWTRDLSQEGLFIETAATDLLCRRILRLRFCAEGVERCVRGTAVYAVPGQGVGVQLAFWRPGDQADQLAYRRLVAAARPARLDSV